MDLNTTMPKEIVKKAYGAVELAKNTGKIKKGINEATKAIERGTAKLVVVAQDTEPKEIVMHIPPLCEEKEIPLTLVPSKEELGASAGLTVPTSCIAILQEGDAKNLIKEIVTKAKSIK